MQLRTVFSLILALWSFYHASAQSVYKSLRPSAEKFAKAIVDYDIDTYCKMTYSQIVELAGGFDTYKEMTKGYKDGLAAAGMMIIECSVDTVGEIVKTQDELQCFVQMNQVTKMATNYFQGTVHILAVSKDNGETWSFVDLETFDEAGLKDFIPTYDSSKLKYPPAVNLVMIEKK